MLVFQYHMEPFATEHQATCASQNHKVSRLYKPCGFKDMRGDNTHSGLTRDRRTYGEMVAYNGPIL